MIPREMTERERELSNQLRIEIDNNHQLVAAHNKDMDRAQQEYNKLASRIRELETAMRHLGEIIGHALRKEGVVLFVQCQCCGGVGVHLHNGLNGKCYCYDSPMSVVLPAKS